MSHEVYENTQTGFQVEWRGLLLTIRLNDHHGFSGSIAEMSDDGKKCDLLDFHGSGPKTPFPAHFHEEQIDAVADKEKA